MWALASLCRRFTDTNEYGTGTENSPQNVHGYTDIFTVYISRRPRTDGHKSRCYLGSMRSDVDNVTPVTKRDTRAVEREFDVFRTRFRALCDNRILRFGSQLSHAGSQVTDLSCRVKISTFHCTIYSSLFNKLVAC